MMSITTTMMTRDCERKLWCKCDIVYNDPHKHEEWCPYARNYFNQLKFERWMKMEELRLQYTIRGRYWLL